MSEEYYLETNKCNSCNRSDSKRIGLSAIGWPFLCYGDVPSFNDWLKILENGDVHNEYGESVEKASFVNFIISKQKHMDDDHWKSYWATKGTKYGRICEDGYWFSLE